MRFSAILLSFAFVLCINAVGTASGATTYSATDLPLPILDAQTTTSTITITDVGSIRDVNVQVNLVHTYDSDLVITLHSPDGRSVVLADGRGGGGDNFANTVFDDEAVMGIWQAYAPFNAFFRPEEPLYLMDGKALQGTWTLTVYDRWGGDEGTLLGWSFIAETGNAAPVAVNDSYSTLHDHAVYVTPAAGILTNDLDGNSEPLSIAWHSDPGHGTLSLNADGSFTYTPPALWAGDDTFSYRVNDGHEDSNTATVTMHVTNGAPTGQEYHHRVHANTVLSVAAPGLRSDNLDPDGDPITTAKVGDGSHGTVTVSSDGAFTYTPEPGFWGDDSFQYSVSDGLATGTGRVFVHVTDYEPFGQSHEFSTPANTTLNVPAPGLLRDAGDVEGDPLTAVWTGDGSHGTVTVSPDGAFTYTPNAGFVGDDTFEYGVSDGIRRSSAFVTVHVIGTGNQPPESPTSPSPADGATGVGHDRLRLSWDCSDPEGDALRYDLYFGERPNHLKRLARGLRSSGYRLPKLRKNETYYWQVVATDSHGARTAGPVWSFTTGRR